MQMKRRRLPNFETCSVALFASLVFYGPLPSKAQTARSTAPSAATSSATATTIPPNRWTTEQLREAFTKSDVNGDGQLSREEASVWAGLSKRFDQIDTSKDGSISSAEFDEALK